MGEFELLTAEKPCGGVTSGNMRPNDSGFQTKGGQLLAVYNNSNRIHRNMIVMVMGKIKRGCCVR